MPSLFPGMDPYLEDPAFWSDFHDSFIVYWADALNAALPDHYEARISGRISLEIPSSNSQSAMRSDVAIRRGGPPESPRWAETSAVATLEPKSIPLQYFEEVRETFLEIRRRPERSVVAMLELLSPFNKSGKDRLAYLEKRQGILRQDVHLVELDLLKGGERVPLKVEPAGDDFQFVSRSDRRPNCLVYGWSIRKQLPTLPIPLLSTDPDILIDLGAVFTTAYDRGRYARSVAYGEPPPGPWDEADREWIIERARTMRP